MPAPEAAEAALIAGLIKWAAHMGYAATAAVELLIWEEQWLRRPDFRAACIRQSAGVTVIRWADVKAFSETQPQCSTTAEAILKVVSLIGNDDLYLAGLGHQNRRAVVRAFAAAVGLEVEVKGDD